MKHFLDKSQHEIRALYECGALGKWNDTQGRRPPPGWDGKAGVLMSREPEGGTAR
jgi:hypothetical protein